MEVCAVSVSFSDLHSTLCVNSVRTVDTLDQRYVLMPAAMKDAYLVHVVHEYLQKNDASSVMIFTNTCKSVAFSSRPLQSFCDVRNRLFDGRFLVNRSPPLFLLCCNPNLSNLSGRPKHSHPPPHNCQCRGSQTVNDDSQPAVSHD